MSGSNSPESRLALDQSALVIAGETRPANQQQTARRFHQANAPGRPARRTRRTTRQSVPSASMSTTSPGAELYDLTKDRNETTNLAEKEPKIAKRMVEATLKWRRALP